MGNNTVVAQQKKEYSAPELSVIDLNSEQVLAACVNLTPPGCMNHHGSNTCS